MHTWQIKEDFKEPENYEEIKNFITLLVTKEESQVAMMMKRLNIICSMRLKMTFQSVLQISFNPITEEEDLKEVYLIFKEDLPKERLSKGVISKVFLIARESLL